MHKRDGLSATHEMYLKIIHQLQESGDPARVGQMAKGLGVHPSTVSAVVRTLDRMGLVTHDRYGVVKLTDVGGRLAQCVVRRFEILRQFFTDILGLDEDTATLDACETEHVLSPITIGRIEHLLESLPASGYTAPTSIPPKMATMCVDCILAGECTAALDVSARSPS
jgi:DtxR family Mn-dependent transcriptional regulator